MKIANRIAGLGVCAALFAATLGGVAYAQNTGAGTDMGTNAGAKTGMSRKTNTHKSAGTATAYHRHHRHHAKAGSHKMGSHKTGSHKMSSKKGNM